VPADSIRVEPGLGLECLVVVDARFEALGAGGKGGEASPAPAPRRGPAGPRFFRVRVGNRAWMAASGLGLGAASSLESQHMGQLEKRGKTAVVACVTSSPSPSTSTSTLTSPAPALLALAVLGVADALRPETRAVVRALSERLGLEVWMISGDNRTTALSLAQDAGIAEERVVAEALPADKAAKVKALCERGRGGVAFVGDGINDAPALARATVGVALGAGSKIAVAAAKVVLVKSDLWDVVCALDLSKVVFRRIKLNFLWALGYNVIGLPIAAGVFFPLQRMQAAPEVAGLAMALSSVSVVASSLLLNYYRRPRFAAGGGAAAGSGGGAPGGGLAAGGGAAGSAAAAAAARRKPAAADEEGESGEADVLLSGRDGGVTGRVAVLDLASVMACACSCEDCACNDETAACVGDGGSGGCCGCSSCRCAAAGRRGKKTTM